MACEYRVKIVENSPLTCDIRLVKVQALEPAAFSSEAGAWMQWRIPGPDGALLKRCFSIASSPRDTATMDFIIRRNPVGLGTKWIFETARLGDELTLWGPNGRFRLHDDGRPAVMVAGGSGLSAIRSLLFAIRDLKVSKPSVTLFFGATCCKQLYLVKELEEFQKSIPNFRFVPALSAAPESDCWKGECGLITDVLDKHLADAPKDLEAYLCGSPGMLDACIAVLSKHGLAEDSIFFDKFLTPKQ